MKSKTSKLVLAVLTLVFAVAGIILAAVYLVNPVVALEGGVRYVLMLWVGAASALVASAVFGFFLARSALGRRGAKLYLCAFAVLAAIAVPSYLYLGYLDHSQYRILTVDGVKRQYLIYVPTTYTKGQAVALLLALHGGTGNARQFQTESGFNQVAEKYGFIVVYPDGLGTFQYSLHVWNSGTIKAASDMGTDDVGFLAALISNLEATYTINSSRVYMTGHSNGGMMTDRMAAEHPELFAAVAPVSSTVGGKATQQNSTYIIPTPDSPVTVIRVHGSEDKNVLYGGGYSQSGFNVGERYDDSENVSVGFWVAADHCQTVPVVSQSSSGRITMDRYLGGAGGAEVALVTVHGENHFWENLNHAVTDEKFHGDSLAEMIWNLLSNHTKTQIVNP